MYAGMEDRARRRRDRLLWILSTYACPTSAFKFHSSQKPIRPHIKQFALKNEADKNGNMGAFIEAFFFNAIMKNYLSA
jgi:hypothetical protein